MAEYAYFYNSENGDRKYDADSFSDWLRKFFTSGVFTGDLQVTSTNSMTVQVSNGYCNVEGKVRNFEGSTSLLIDNANPTYNRKDIIVVERNDAERNITIKAITGDYSTDPVAPSPVREGGIYQLVLAEIYVAAGATSIPQSVITDKRADKTVCGIVAGTVEEMDFSQFAAQFNDYYNYFVTTNQQEFIDWFNHLKAILDDNVAAHLQNEIDVINSELTNITNNIESTQRLVSDEWDSATTYTVGQYCIYSNQLWMCKTQNSNQVPSEGSYWTKTSVGLELNAKKIGNPKTVYHGDLTYLTTNNTVLYTAPSDGYISIDPVISNGYGAFLIGDINRPYFNGSSSEMRVNISGFIKKGQTVRVTGINGSGVRKDMNMIFVPVL